MGRNIAAARERARLSQEQLGAAAGISRDTVWRTETGTRAARVDWLTAMADALQVPLADFFRDV